MTGPARTAAGELGALKILGVVLASTSMTSLNSERIRHCVE